MARHEALVEKLYTARLKGQNFSGFDSAIVDLETALELQLEVLKRFESEGERLGGWKIGLTSGNARNRMGEGIRPFGFVLQSRVFASGSRVPLINILNCHVEPEICLVLKKPLIGPDITTGEAKAAVGAVVPAFEINEIRVNPQEEGNIALVADGLAHWGIVLGPETGPGDGLTGTTVEFSCNGELLGTKTPGQTMDDPYLSLARLCKQLDRFGRGLKPGQPVITGSFFHQAVKSPAKYQASFAKMGDVGFEFS